MFHSVLLGLGRLATAACPTSPYMLRLPRRLSTRGFPTYHPLIGDFQEATCLQYYTLLTATHARWIGDSPGRAGSGLTGGQRKHVSLAQTQAKEELLTVLDCLKKAPDRGTLYLLDSVSIGKE